MSLEHWIKERDDDKALALYKWRKKALWIVVCRLKEEDEYGDEDDNENHIQIIALHHSNQRELLSFFTT